MPKTSLLSVSNQTFTIPKPKCSLYKESLSYSGPVIWNAIPHEIKQFSTLGAFTNKLLGWISNDDFSINYNDIPLPPFALHSFTSLYIPFNI